MLITTLLLTARERTRLDWLLALALDAMLIAWVSALLCWVL